MMGMPAIQTFQFMRECGNTGHSITPNKTNGKNFSNILDIVTYRYHTGIVLVLREENNKKTSTESVHKKTSTNRVDKKKCTDNVHQTRTSKGVITDYSLRGSVGIMYMVF